jgi:hypothetical protein
MDKLTSQPKSLFLIDSLGAFLTAFLLGVILTSYEVYFGMPARVLYPLSALACVFGLYSMGCYFWVRSHWRPFLKAIALANLAYCLLTTGLVFLFYQSLTILGILYFSGELIVISVLIYIELSAVSKKTRSAS